MEDTFTERLRQAVTAAGSIQRLAERSGIAARTISGYLAGKGDPSRKRVVALAQAAGVSTEWLASGYGCTREPVPAAASAHVTSGPPPLPERYTAIPPLDLDAECDESTSNGDSSEPTRLAFAHRELEERGLTSDRGCLIVAPDDSMAPTLLRGDTVLVNTAIHEVRDNALYCIRVGSHPNLKRLQNGIHGGLWLISDAWQYMDEYVAADQVTELAIVGKAVWIGRDI